MRHREEKQDAHNFIQALSKDECDSFLYDIVQDSFADIYLHIAHDRQLCAV